MKKNLLMFALASGVLLSSCSFSASSKDSDRTTRNDDRSLEIIQAIQKSFKDNGGEDISYRYLGPSDSYYIVGAVKKEDADLANLMEHSSAYLLEGWSVVTASSYDEGRQTYSMKYGYDNNDITVAVCDYQDPYDSNLNDIEFNVRVNGSAYSRLTTYGNEDCIQTIASIGYKMFGKMPLEDNYDYDCDGDFYYAIGMITTGNDTMLTLIRKAPSFLPSDYALKSSPEYLSDESCYKAVYTCASGMITIDVYTFRDSTRETCLDLQFSVYLSEEE